MNKSELTRHILGVVGTLLMMFGGVSMAYDIAPNIYNYFTMMLGAAAFLIEVPNIIRAAKWFFLERPLVKTVVWYFSDNFLGMSSGEGEWVRIHSFSVCCKNKTGKHIDQFSGHVSSIKTGKDFPAFISVDGNLFPFEKTNGIPNGAKFYVVVPFADVNVCSQPDMCPSPEVFLAEFCPFKFVADCGGKIVERNFSVDEVAFLIEKFRIASKRNHDPHITLKKT